MPVVVICDQPDLARSLARCSLRGGPLRAIHRRVGLSLLHTVATLRPEVVVVASRSGFFASCLRTVVAPSRTRVVLALEHERSLAFVNPLDFDAAVGMQSAELMLSQRLAWPNDMSRRGRRFSRIAVTIELRRLAVAGVAVDLGPAGVGVVLRASDAGRDGASCRVLFHRRGRPTIDIPATLIWSSPCLPGVQRAGFLLAHRDAREVHALEFWEATAAASRSLQFHGVVPQQVDLAELFDATDHGTTLDLFDAACETRSELLSWRELLRPLVTLRRLRLVHVPASLALVLREAGLADAVASHFEEWRCGRCGLLLWRLVDERRLALRYCPECRGVSPSATD